MSDLLIVDCQRRARLLLRLEGRFVAPSKAIPELEGMVDTWPHGLGNTVRRKRRQVAAEELFEAVERVLLTMRGIGTLVCLVSQAPRRAATLWLAGVACAAAAAVPREIEPLLVTYGAWDVLVERRVFDLETIRDVALTF